jgi:hypothetical protein
LIEPSVNGFAASLFPAFCPVFPSKKMKYEGPGVLTLADGWALTFFGNFVCDRFVRDEGSGENEESSDEIDRR